MWITDQLTKRARKHGFYAVEGRDWHHLWSCFSFFESDWVLFLEEQVPSGHQFRLSFTAGYVNQSGYLEYLFNNK